MIKGDKMDTIKEARYYNSNGKGITIVASISIWNKDAEGIEHGDWSAYIGADNGESEENCIRFALEYGAKLSREDAKYYFPEITLPYRL